MHFRISNKLMQLGWGWLDPIPSESTAGMKILNNSQQPRLVGQQNSLLVLDSYSPGLWDTSQSWHCQGRLVKKRSMGHTHSSYYKLKKNDSEHLNYYSWLFYAHFSFQLLMPNNYWHLGEFCAEQNSWKTLIHVLRFIVEDFNHCYHHRVGYKQ